MQRSMLSVFLSFCLSFFLSVFLSFFLLLVSHIFRLSQAFVLRETIA